MPDVSTVAPKGFFINGQWHTQGKCAEVRSPFDQSVVGSVTLAGRRELEHAIEAAVEAFAITRRMPSYKRQSILARISTGILNRKEEFARMMALEAGKPIRTARAEVDRAVFTFQIAAEEATRIA
ncbi:MAG TPA: aldehyde dehydrogenase family protein, partial [Terriglobales bacterium]